MESKRLREVNLKDAIFEKAAELFSRRGFDNVSVREIAEECNVTKPALYYYFESKETLAKSLVDDLIDMLHSRLTDILENPSDNPLDLFTRLVSAYFDLGKNKKYLVHFMVSQMFTGFEHDLGEHISVRHNQEEEIIRKALQPFINKGLILPDSHNGFTVFLLGTMLVLYLSHIHKDIKELTPELARCVAADILYGFSARNPERTANTEISGIHARVTNLWEIK